LTPFSETANQIKTDSVKIKDLIGSPEIAHAKLLRNQPQSNSF
jgi:hypothetical protein